MRTSIHDYAVKFEEAKELTWKLKTKGFPSLLSERLRRAHYPSDLTDCMRRRYYSFKGVPETNPITFKGKCVLAFGSLMDDLATKLAIRARIYVEDEFSFEINHQSLTQPISGRIDIVIEEEDGTLIPVEVKSIKSDQFYDRELKWETGSRKLPGVITEPKLANVSQLMTYVYFMGTKYGYLIYWNKDNQDLYIHKVYWSEELFNDAVKDCQTLERYIELETVPPRPVNFNVVFYQRDGKYGKKGEVKADEMGFPCLWRDRETGEDVYCRFWDTCWATEVLNSSEAGDAVKERIRRSAEAQKARTGGGEESQPNSTTLM